MRRALTFVLTTALILTGVTTADAAWRREQFRFQGLDRGKWTDHEVKATIRAVAHRWHVPGGVDKALDVARCESGFEHVTSGSHLGVYQFARQTWRSQTRRFRERRRRLDVSRRALNARSNVAVAIWLAHTRAGWGPWTCG